MALNASSSMMLNIISFNCKHYVNRGPKFEFMKSLLAKCDVLMLQEHCLFQSKIDKLKDLGTNVDVNGKSAMNDLVPLVGRPHGGCAIVYKTNTNCKINEVYCNHVRLCGVTMCTGSSTTLILNAYMPCDTGRNDQNYDEFLDVLGEVTQVIHRVNPTFVVFGGDLNSDLSRRSPQVNLLSEFINTQNLIVTIDSPNADVPYTYIGPQSTSRIDHFLLSQAAGDDISSCDIVDNALYSDHVPVRLSLNFDITRHKVLQRPYETRISWCKATDQNILMYKSRLEDILNDVEFDQEVLTCKNVKCTKHKEMLSNLYKNVIGACLIASEENIPKCTKSRSKKNDKDAYTCRDNIPGWNEHVEALHNESLMWHNYWKSAGRPHAGDVAEMRRMSRARYHKAVREILRKNDVLKMERMADAISNNKSRDLWKEVKKIKGRNCNIAGSIDGITDKEDIASIFGGKYKALYNSVPYDIDELNTIQSVIDERIDNCDKCFVVSVEMMCKAVRYLKSGKSGGIEGIKSEHFIHAPHKFFVMLTSIINAMLVHGYSPESMLTGIMVPIPKNKNTCNSDNYRAITLNSITGKLLDLVILLNESSGLQTSELQFGFKPEVSTTQCTFLMNEVISYYNSRKSSVYVALLDATKAFDRVNFCKLFKKLLDRDISPILLRLLLFMYTGQKLKVRWSDHDSQVFCVSNGVKQGGVLSPVLFSVYVDDLFKRLESNGVGCHIGNHFVGCIGYADDLTLLAPSGKALQTMIKVCEDYADDFDILFNGSKSQLLVFRGISCGISDCTVVVNNTCIDSSENAIHLGHYVSCVDKSSMVRNCVNKFWQQYNVLMSDFGNICPYLTCKLFKQYCTNFYGAPLLSFANHDLIAVAWRKALRRLWRIPPQTHCTLVALLCESSPIEISLKERFRKFCNTVMNSKNKVMQCVVKKALTNPFSIFCSNYIHLKRNYENCIISNKNINHLWFENVSLQDRATVAAIQELVEMRDGTKTCILTDLEVNSMIEELCVR